MLVSGAEANCVWSVVDLGFRVCVTNMSQCVNALNGGCSVAMILFKHQRSLKKSLSVRENICPAVCLSVCTSSDTSPYPHIERSVGVFAWRLATREVSLPFARLCPPSTHNAFMKGYYAEPFLRHLGKKKGKGTNNKPWCPPSDGQSWELAIMLQWECGYGFDCTWLTTVTQFSMTKPLKPVSEAR